MAQIRIVGDNKYEAQCRLCGAWQEVQPQPVPGYTYFSHFQAEYTCCGVQQTAQLTVERDEMDVH
jgi:hypothetical protein